MVLGLAFEGPHGNSLLLLDNSFPLYLKYPSLRLFHSSPIDQILKATLSMTAWVALLGISQYSAALRSVALCHSLCYTLYIPRTSSYWLYFLICLLRGTNLFASSLV